MPGVRRSATSFGANVLIRARELASFDGVLVLGVAASATFYAYSSVRERLRVGRGPLDGACFTFAAWEKEEDPRARRESLFSRTFLLRARLRCRRRRDACSFLFGVWCETSPRALRVISPERPTDGPLKSIRLRGCDRFACLTQISELPPPSGRGSDADRWPARVVTGALLRQDVPLSKGSAGLAVKGYLPRQSYCRAVSLLG